MDAIDTQHPAWSYTFPHRVAPKSGEALVGLLLRCDRANHWESGATCTFLSRELAPRAPVWVNRANLFVPPKPLVELLAYRLDLPVEAVVATTYLNEQRRFFAADPSMGDLCFWSVFQVCPVCIKEQRLLLRSHFLWGLRSCLEHQVVLLPNCACDALLKPFRAETEPFTCPTCRKDWGTLSPLQASPEDLEKERQILACYEWWFKHGDAAAMKEILLWLKEPDAIRKRDLPGARWSAFTVREARRRFLAGSSHMGSLSGLVGRLDELGLLSRFSEERGGRVGFQDLFAATAPFVRA